MLSNHNRMLRCLINHSISTVPFCYPYTSCRKWLLRSPLGTMTHFITFLKHIIMSRYQPTSAPPYLTTQEAGSFAAFSLQKRLPVILNKLLDDADETTARALQQLATEMHTASITPLPPSVFGSLDQIIEPYCGRYWNEMPFLTVELYFYARILLAFGYTTTTPVDPFQVAKQTANLQAIEALASPADYYDPDCDIETLLHWSVIGNTADLSQQVIPDVEQISLLVDESDAVKRLFDSGMRRIDVVFDNAGIDSLADLLLIRRISQCCSQVVAHVRPWPMFVSDMTITNLKDFIRKLEISPIPTAHTLGKDIIRLLQENRLMLRSSPALGLPASFYENKTLTCETFEDAELVIFKGDLNYRFFAGDRRWPHTTKKDYLLQHFGRSALFLRTLKSEVLVGLSTDIAAKTLQLQSDWLTSGHYGIIQTFTSQN